MGDQDKTFGPESVQQIVDNAPGLKRMWILEGVDYGIGTSGVPEAGLRATLTSS